VVTRITNELGMSATRSRLTPEMQDHLATGYRDGEQFPLWYNPTLAGAGDLRSTVHDLLTYLAAYVGLTNSSLYDAMQVTLEPRYPIDSTMKIGLAWQIHTRGEPRMVEHLGATGGYYGYAGFVEDKQTGVVVLTNTFNNISDIGVDLLRTATSQTAAATSTSPPSP
jgi:D-alanyl-D-alanine-carboxypeptidase/D-alanyl-D-alanine-endopeptidase